MTITYPISPPSGLNPSNITFTPSDVVAVAASMFTGQQQVQRFSGQWWVLSFDYPTLTAAQLDLWAAFLLRLKGRFGTFTIGDPTKTTPSGVATGTPVIDSTTVLISTSAITVVGSTELTFTDTTGVRLGMSASGSNILSGSNVIVVTATSVTLNYAVNVQVASSTSVTFSGMSGDYLYTKGWTNGITGILKAGDYVQHGTGSSSHLYRLTADANSDGSGKAALEVWPQVRQSPAAPTDGDSLITTNTVGLFRLNQANGWSIKSPVIGSLTITASEVV